MFCHVTEACDLYNKIPKEKPHELFENSDAGAEMDFTFLGFEDTYQKALEIAPKDMVVIDLGCAYACQSWYFKDHAAYIGVDLGTIYKPDATYEDQLNGVIQTDNSTFYFESIQNFITNTLPTLNLDLGNVFAICSAVPDQEARQMMRDTFPNYLDWYPGEKMAIQIKHWNWRPLKTDRIFPTTQEAKEYAYSSTRAATYRPDKSKNALEVKHLLEEKQEETYER